MAVRHDNFTSLDSRLHQIVSENIWGFIDLAVCELSSGRRSWRCLDNTKPIWMGLRVWGEDILNCTSELRPMKIGSGIGKDWFRRSHDCWVERSIECFFGGGNNCQRSREIIGVNSCSVDFCDSTRGFEDILGSKMMAYGMEDWSPVSSEVKRLQRDRLLVVGSTSVATAYNY